MSKHPHHPHPTHPHHGGKKGRHHRPTKAELAAQAEASARAHQATTVAMREKNGASMAGDIAAWQDEIRATPMTNETPISPMAVPMEIVSQFDSARRTRDKKPYMHGAIDGIPAIPTHEPVGIVAAVSGRVLFVGNWDLDSGYAVMVGGKDGRIYSYAHLKKNSAAVQVGQAVAQGDAIGIMGTTGNASERACLHYKVREPQQVAGLIPVSAVVTDAPDASLTPVQLAERASLSSFNLVWPKIDGNELRNGMVVQPGQRPVPLQPQPVLALDNTLLEGLRKVAPLDSSITAELLAPLTTPIVLDSLPALPKLNKR